MRLGLLMAQPALRACWSRVTVPLAPSGRIYSGGEPVDRKAVRNTNLCRTHRVPSADLRPNQGDLEWLPAYAWLDEILAVDFQKVVMQKVLRLEKTTSLSAGNLG